MTHLMDQNILTLQNVHIGYQKKEIVQDINFSLKKTQHLAILGDNGSGKTTLLKSIAGFLPICSGEIYLRGQKIGSTNLHQAPNKRKIGFIFQTAALFPHKTVAQNIGYGLKGKKNQTRRVQELMEFVEITEYHKKYPYQLSLGQMQRVHIAQAIAQKPDLILMDEAFASIDASMKKQLAHRLFKLFQEENISSIFITHEKEEALSYAYQIAILEKGRLQCYKSVQDIFHKPSSCILKHLSRGFKISKQDMIMIAPHTAVEKTEFFIHYNDIQIVDLDKSPLKARVFKKIDVGGKYFYCLEVLNSTSMDNHLHLESRKYYKEGCEIALKLDSWIPITK